MVFGRTRAALNKFLESRKDPYDHCEFCKVRGREGKDGCPTTWQHWPDAGCGHVKDCVGCHGTGWRTPFNKCSLCEGTGTVLDPRLDTRVLIR